MIVAFDIICNNGSPTANMRTRGGNGDPYHSRLPILSKYKKVRPFPLSASRVLDFFLSRAM